MTENLRFESEPEELDEETQAEVNRIANELLSRWGERGGYFSESAIRGGTIELASEGADTAVLASAVVAKLKNSRTK